MASQWKVHSLWHWCDFANYKARVAEVNGEYIASWSQGQHLCFARLVMGVVQASLDCICWHKKYEKLMDGKIRWLYICMNVYTFINQENISNIIGLLFATGAI